MRIRRLSTGLMATVIVASGLSMSAPAQATEDLTTTAEISVDTKRLAYGEELNLVGLVHASDGGWADQGSASMQFRTPANPEWGTLSNEAYAGSFANYGYIPTSKADYRVVYYGYTATSESEDNYAPSTSAPITVRVSRDIKVRTHGRRIVGKVSPDYRHRKVKVMQKIDGKYVALPKVRTNQNSKFKVTLPAGERGDVLRFRLYIAGNARFAATREVFGVDY